ncbi:GerAB/ArcD/ProY family transporter [Alkalibacillus haloalkaliphilus]|uniref:GerAB/ArcD/ProY family transporter n=1 Tax=Alkalibacillus haloalkaliphilus TaxID=94136 RepID=UPI0003639910|nr:endospore germination permease [Alkalibacillus haloalkaliphilus]
MKNERINFIYALLLLVTSVGLLNHVIMIPALYEAAGRDAWLSIIGTFIALIPWVYIIPYIAKKTNQEHIIKWMQDRISKWIVYPIVAFISLFLLLTTIVTLYDLTIWTSITYLPNTPKLILLIMFLFICLYLASMSIRTIVIVNTILLPIIIFLGFFVATSNLQNKNYSLLFPVLIDGFHPMLMGMIFTTACMVEVFIIVFIQHRIKTKIRYSGILITTAVLMMLGLGPVMGGIAAFGPEVAMKQRFPAYSQWQLVTIGRYIEHLDFFSVYQWLSGGLIRISLSLFMLMEILRINQVKKRKIILPIICLFVLTITMLPINDMLFVSFLKNFYLPFNLIFITTLSFVLLIIVMIKGKGKGSS